jgi:hypothetical protein
MRKEMETIRFKCEAIEHKSELGLDSLSSLTQSMQVGACRALFVTSEGKRGRGLQCKTEAKFKEWGNWGKAWAIVIS